MDSLGKTAKHYRSNRRSYLKKLKKDKEINKRPEQVKKRVESNRQRRKAKREGKNIRGKDYDHAVKKFVPLKVNRGRNEKSRKKGSKRNA